MGIEKTMEESNMKNARKLSLKKKIRINTKISTNFLREKEWQGKFDEIKIVKHYKKIKSAIKKQKLPDSYFVRKYTFSPYMACEHGCVYCDGRAERYYVEGDYERDIVIRKNLPQILEKEISTLREKGSIFVGSGITDAYQPVEKEENIMKQCAEIIAKSNLSAAVLTKSSIIERDLDIWKAVNEKSGFTLMMSLTFSDDKFRKIFEPNASSVEERIETLKKFKAAGISTGVMAMPFLPFISDSNENILFQKLKDAEIDFIMPGFLTLRPGKQKEFYFNIIKKHFPNLVNKYEILYGNNLLSGSPIFSYRQKMLEKIDKSIISFNFLQQIPHKIYKDRFPIYDEIYILLNHMKNLYKKKNINVINLKNATKKYSEWLITEKTTFNRKRKLTHAFLEDKLIALFENEEFQNILKNEKLYEFLKEVVINRKIFDYRKLKLIY